MATAPSLTGLTRRLTPAVLVAGRVVLVVPGGLLGGGRVAAGHADWRWERHAGGTSLTAGAGTVLQQVTADQDVALVFHAMIM